MAVAPGTRHFEKPPPSPYPVIAMLVTRAAVLGALSVLVCMPCLVVRALREADVGAGQALEGLLRMAQCRATCLSQAGPACDEPRRAAFRALWCCQLGSARGRCLGEAPGAPAQEAASRSSQNRVKRVRPEDGAWAASDARTRDCSNRPRVVWLRVTGPDRGQTPGGGGCAAERSREVEVGSNSKQRPTSLLLLSEWESETGCSGQARAKKGTLTLVQRFNNPEFRAPRAQGGHWYYTTSKVIVERRGNQSVRALRLRFAGQRGGCRTARDAGGLTSLSGEGRARAAREARGAPQDAVSARARSRKLEALGGAAVAAAAARLGDMASLPARAASGAQSVSDSVALLPRAREVFGAGGASDTSASFANGSRAA
ncbi:hypothetical protein HPB48_026269 [Haemaphysalis longicornis]|uniref:Uncharacterized protein n=1 Tax=Haemaphysalis longicornis TaxID=44386 RepID=A0A9J6HAD8_HAELO|nr:hypothetical protein HPB48_026269 [Haemaphysalis longicornis]